MYIIEVTLKANPLSLSVQRKEKDDALELYGSILAAIKSSEPEILQLTCERQPEKMLAVITSEIMAVQVSEKSSSASNLGARAGFLSARE
ncbi:hypothetical protein [Anthocerotibacter panamensis]|uniref:hypothetical protein n=1 Tax=Anthocerotibacter panamensis TaxID=2857077 RepID=UPI001C402D60|nr:hypothetical protein [Anthocerotibacter panamensis]